MEYIKKIDDKYKYYDYLWDLGRAMLAYYRCTELLSQLQIELIANSSDEDKIHAMEYAIINENNYKWRKEIFYRNTAAINRAKRRILK